jgi:hypothetical protein
MGVLLSVNVARTHIAEYSGGPTGIDKRPVAAPGPSSLGPDGPTATAGSGLVGDSVYYVNTAAITRPYTRTRAMNSTPGRRNWGGNCPAVCSART